MIRRNSPWLVGSWFATGPNGKHRILLIRLPLEGGYIPSL
jgi:hypothetical protein